MRKDSSSRQAYQAVKELIIFGDLKPGAQIDETMIQSKLGISRASMRDAFLILVREELVVNEFRKGFQVSHVSPKKIQDIYEIRQMLEPNAVIKGMQNIERGWLMEIRRKFIQLSECPRSTPIHYIKLDNEFHNTLMSSLNNAYASDLLECGLDYLAMVRLNIASDPRGFFERYLDHVSIIDAILQNDREKTSQLLRTHIQISYDTVIKYMIRSSL